MTQDHEPDDGFSAVVLDLDSAREQRDPPDGPPTPKGPQDPPRKGGGAVNEFGLPDGCPVIPLGIHDDLCFYLDANRQFRALKVEKHSRLGVMGLFGARNHMLYTFWPRLNADGDTTGWRPELASEQLMAACSKRGVMDALDRCRGAGAWLGHNGELVLHCGDAIWIGPAPGAAEGRAGWHDPGIDGRYVYPAAPPIMRPHELSTATGEGGPAHELLELLMTWRWGRGELDAVLLLGWIGAAFLGGALKWRPVGWITGGAGTGKSTLHRLLQLVFDEALVSVSDASAAGIWQKLRHSTLPVAFDELEADDDNRQANNVVKLARQAASGGLVLRGGAEHQGREFVARSCFLFSSILVPPLLGQDRSRIAMLNLERFKSGAIAPTLEAEHLRDVGAQLLRGLADHWCEFPRILESYRAALEQRGHDARGADVFGTLLACAHVMLHGSECDSQTVDAWAVKLEAERAIDSDEALRDEELCIRHILTYAIDPYRNGTRSMMGEWVQKAAGIIEGDTYEANKALQSYGLKVEIIDSVKWLAVANYHSGLDTVFKGKHWAGRSGAMGVWVQALQRLPGAERSAKTVYYAGGVTARATMLPLDTVIAGGELPAGIFEQGDGEGDDA